MTITLSSLTLDYLGTYSQCFANFYTYFYSLLSINQSIASFA